jgi:hypothetical protein
MRGSIVRKALIGLSAAVTLAGATIATPTTADARRGWVNPVAIVTSDYYGGYWTYAPAPIYYHYYAAPVYYDYNVGPGSYLGCWRWRHGNRYRVC